MTVANQRGYQINISVKTNITYPLNYREGDSSWNMNHNNTEGNITLWSCIGCILSTNNESLGDWSLNITY